MNSPLFSIIIVNYRSVRSVGRLLDSFERARLGTMEYEVIVSNNDIDERQAIDILAKQHGFKAIHNAGNLGFGTANNRVEAIAQGKYLFFCNPDTELLLGDIREAARLFKTRSKPHGTNSDPSDAVSEPFESRLLGVSHSETDGFQPSESPQEGFAREEMVSEEIGNRSTRNRPAPGIIGFRLVTPTDRTEKWSVGPDVSLWEIIRNNLGFPPGKKLWASRQTTEVGRISGAALMIPKDLFRELGGFDEGFFLYFEDADLCRRARQAGRAVIYYPSVTLRHHGGQSMPSLAEQKKHYYTSQTYYFRKHRPGWESILLRFFRKQR